MKTTVIVPTYNEVENITPLVEALFALPLILHILIVDDNSPDGTGAVADELANKRPARMSVIHRAGKLGLGTAYVAGFRQAMDHDSDLVVTMDADFSHPPTAIPAMVARIDRGFDLVIGSRYVPGGRTVGWPGYRKFLSRGANTFARLLLGLRAHDATAGFRCYRREVLESVPLATIRSNGYSFLIELLYAVQQEGWRVGEVPITFANRCRGTSKISQVEISRAFFTVLRLFGERLLQSRRGQKSGSNKAGT
ncbi:MAG: polyprenol monophosphomannose synthase, partial [Anaerolineae bacterium]